MLRMFKVDFIEIRNQQLGLTVLGSQHIEHRRKQSPKQFIRYISVHLNSQSRLRVSGETLATPMGRA